MIKYSGILINNYKNLKNNLIILYYKNGKL